MNREKNTRREFIKMTAVSGVALGVSGNVSQLLAQTIASDIQEIMTPDTNELKANPFIPHRAASWWCTLEDILWPQKKVTDKIKHRAEAFAKAGIDTAINFGFHIRFDYSNYFHQLHGYYRNVCEELHRYNIRFMDHYSCNHTTRPRNESEFIKVHKWQRHHVLLFPDSVAARHAQYEGHLFDDLCELDITDGSRGYSGAYQIEVFCPNNPGFLEMHRKYLTRLLKEVPLDGIQVDDMCDYAGLRTCGCRYCRERLKRDYDRVIPPFSDKDFWGNTSGKNSYHWGNYENPAFRDWLRMKSDSFVDHLKMIRSVIGGKPLMTCVSSSGPIVLNSLSLNVEKMAPELDFFMLENVGINIHGVNWVHMDAEALNQKDIAHKQGKAPALALSYTIYEKGGYLGWSLARFWGVVNWSSTLNSRLIEEPPDAMEIEDIISPYNHWELKNSDLANSNSQDFVEARLVSSLDCRENGWRNEQGQEQWDSVKAWSSALVRHNMGYRFLRSAELADERALCSEKTPLILDNVGSISNAQWHAIKKHLAEGGTAWVSLPFGVCDDKGIKRSVPLSEELMKMRYKNLVILPSAVVADPLKYLMSKNKFHPVVKQISGDANWAIRIRFYDKNPVLHFLKTALVAIPHPLIKDISGVPVLKDIRSDSKDNKLVYEIDTARLTLPALFAMSPEWGKEQRKIMISKMSRNVSRMHINLENTTIYAVAQQKT